MLKFEENYEPTEAEIEWLRDVSEMIGRTRDWKADLACLRDEMIMFGSSVVETEPPPAGQDKAE